MRCGALPLALILAVPAGAVRAEDPPPAPFEAWEKGFPALDPAQRTRQRNRGQGADPAPLELPLPRGAGPLDGRGELAAREGWPGVVGHWFEVGEDQGEPSAGLTAPRGPWTAWTATRALARALQARVPALGREPLRGLVEPQAQPLFAAPAGQRDSAWRQLLARYPASEQAPLVTRLLGEALCEEGDLDGALLLWRDLLAQREDQPLGARVRDLRVQLLADRAGSLAAPRGASARPWGVRWARALGGGAPWEPRPAAGDGERLYLVDGQGVLAVQRDVGLLAWRCPLRGDPAVQRLALARGTLVLLRPDRVVGIASADGALRWERRVPEGARLHDVVATPAGFALLLTLDGTRVLQGWSDQGARVWEQKLWRGPEREQVARWYEPGVDRARPEGEQLTLTPGPPRVVEGDGRLACLADRVYLTQDGVVACASAALGELRWLQDVTPARALRGSCLRVQLAVGPFAVEAVTGLGHLVRLDPLDGAALPLPSPPAGAREPDPWLLTLDPLTLLYPAEEGFLLTAGVQPRALVRLALGPVGPGVIHGRQLCLPDPEGVVRFDLATGAELGVVPWPLGAGPLQLAGGLLLAGSPRGVAVLGHLAAAPTERPADPGPDPADWIRALDAGDWRTRLLAQERLAGVDEPAIPSLEGALQRARTLDARDRARDLLERLRLRRLMRELAPEAPASLLADLGQGIRVAERLRELRPYVRPGERGSPELSEQVLEVQDPAVRYALFEVLLRLDGKLRDRLGAVVADGNAALRLRQACAGALVELAATGGPTSALRRAYEDPRGVGAEAILAAVLARRDPELLRRALGQEREAPPDEELEEPDPLAHEALLEALPGLLPRR